jgi:hypothetical protein
VSMMWRATSAWLYLVVRAGKDAGGERDGVVLEAGA